MAGVGDAVVHDSVVAVDVVGHADDRNPPRGLLHRSSPQAHPSSGLGPHIITPLRKNAAVHHGKNCADVAMGHVDSAMSATCPLYPQSLQRRMVSKGARS